MLGFLCELELIVQSRNGLEFPAEGMKGGATTGARGKM